MRILVTGGTVFVSRYAAQYFAARGHEVTVLNRGTRPQTGGVRVICRDRHDPALNLRDEGFDAVLDVTAYTGRDVDALLRAAGEDVPYVLVSSSAVYPETLPQPFREDMPVGPNGHWGAYGTDKIAAEEQLLSRGREAYVLRPPYLYGPGNNVYREAFVFDCALADRPFYLPGDGSMPLQLMHVRDLCRLMEAVLLRRPAQRVINAGSPEAVTVRQWAGMCYEVCGKTPRFVQVDASVPQRSYFPFHPYAYYLDVSIQQTLLEGLTPLPAGLAESLAWYNDHGGEVRRKPLMDYIDSELKHISEHISV